MKFFNDLLHIGNQLIGAASSSNDCCNALSKELGAERVARLLSTSYAAQSFSYWSQQEQQVRPTCRVTPTSSEHVSTAVKILSTGKCQFAIRGGGHMSFAGAANVEGGVTIDMSSMKSLTLNPEKTVASVGAGAKWGDIYPQLDALELAIMGGRVASVGVGGLTVGGGLSYFSPRYGYVADSVENFEVVLANGEIVNANRNDRPDLYLALRGGGNNFAVVTRFDFKTFKQGKLWGGFIYYPESTAAQQFKAVETFTNASNKDPYASLITSLVYVGLIKSYQVANNLVYTKPEEYPAIFKPFADIKPQTIKTVGIRSLTSLAKEIAFITPAGMRQLFATVTFGNDAALFAAIYEIEKKAYDPVRGSLGFQVSFSLEPVPTIIHEKSADNPNILGLDASDGNTVWLCMTIAWSLKKDDDAITAATTTFINDATKYAKERNLFNDYIYVNYALQSQDPYQSYGSENHARLKSISEIYDPDRVFQKLVPGGFKLER
ncbi:MAG: hypothetical protein M1837_001746 [Sclerophora amabilis]|nr:MAG: hypothetical protein M1837_001746 [Sclerophora amabilis]